MKPEKSSSEPVDEIVDSILAEMRAGKVLLVDDYAARYPKHEPFVREIWPVLVTMERYKPVGSPGNLTAGEQNPSPWIGKRFGDYLILRELGRGGMGTVYEAEQISLDRRVALKVLPLDNTTSRTRIARFAIEAKAVAKLHHTNIVPIFDIGSDADLQYYAMQLIDGCPLDQWIMFDRNRLWDGKAQQSADDTFTQGRDSSTARGKDSGFAAPGKNQDLELPKDGDKGTTADYFDLRYRELSRAIASIPVGTSSSGPDASIYFRNVATLGWQLALALQHAHNHGILHRDIKPANLLLGKSGRVWITDFGLAKWDELPNLTETGELLGTLRYLAPECLNDVATSSSDVYSLGLCLYELTTLQPVRTAQSRFELIKQVASGAIRKPSAIEERIPVDLETIILTAVDVDVGRRYESAQALADDLQLFLMDEPIKARPLSALGRIARWCKRNKMSAVLTGGVLCLLIAFVLSSSIAALLFRRQAHAFASLASQESQAKYDAENRLFDSSLAEARAVRWSKRIGQRVQAERAIQTAVPLWRSLKLEESQLFALRNEAIAAITSVDLIPQLTIKVLFNTETAVAVSPNQQWIAVDDRLSEDPAVVIYRYREPGKAVHRLPMIIGESSYVQFSSDSRYVAFNDQLGKHLVVYEVESAQKILESAVSNRNFDFSPDAESIALVNENGELLVFNLDGGNPPLPLGRGNGGITALAFSPDGRQLATARDKQLTIHDVSPEGETFQVRKWSGRCYGIGWHAVAKQIVLAGWQRLEVIDLKKRESQRTFVAHDSQVVNVVYHPHADLLFSDSWDGKLKIWNPRTGDCLFQMQGKYVSLVDNGRKLAISQGLELQVAELVLPGGLQWIAPGDGHDMDVSRDGRWLAIARKSQQSDVMRLSDFQRVATIPSGETEGILFHPTKSQVITSGENGLLGWDFSVNQAGEVTFAQHQNLNSGQRFLSSTIDASEDGLTGIFCEGLDRNKKGEAVLINLRGPSPVFKSIKRRYLREVACSSSGRWVATGNKWGQGVDVWDGTTAEHIKTLPSAGSARIAFSPDEKWLLVNSGESIRFWNTMDWSMEKEFAAASTAGAGVAFSRDGRYAAYSSEGIGTVLLNANTLEPLATLKSSPNEARVERLEFTPDGTRLFSLDGERGTWVWELDEIQDSLAKFQLEWTEPTIRL